MKYKTIIETDDFEDFKFFKDGNGKYLHGIDAGAENNEWIALYFTECEQEPKTVLYSGDVISRQAVLDIDFNRIIHTTAKPAEMIKQKVEQLPPIRPQEKTGHREYNDIYNHYLCENCKTIVMDYDNFCPNCGTRMIEPQESEDNE